MHAKVIDIRPYLAKHERKRRLLEKERRRLERNQAILDQYRPRRPKPVRGVSVAMLERTRNLLGQVNALVIEVEDILEGVGLDSLADMLAAHEAAVGARSHLRTAVQRAECTPHILAAYKGRHLWNDRKVCVKCGVSRRMARHMNWECER